MALEQAPPAADLLVQTTNSQNGATVSNAATGGITYGTSFPSSPANGAIHVLVDSTTDPTWIWTFRYNAVSTSLYKWENIGGAAWVSAASSVSLPAFNGDYVIEAKGSGGSGGSTTGANKDATLTVNGVTKDTQNASNVPASSGSVFSYGGAASNWAVGSLMALVTGATGGQTVAITGATSNPQISILPKRLAG